jgi:hypothetical protein
LHGWQLLAGIVEAVDLREGLQPRLATLLAHNAVRTPRRQTIIEALVSRSQRLLGRKWHAGIVKTGQVAHPVVGRRGHHPGVAAITQYVGEPTVILKDEDRLVGKCSQYGVPVNRVMKINVEIADDRPALQRHVRRGRKIGLLDVLHITDQGLLRSAA